MTGSTFTSRDFNQDIASAKRATMRGPVYITHRGRVAHVLLSAEEFERLRGKHSNIADLLHDAKAAEIDFQTPRREELASAIDFD